MRPVSRRERLGWTLAAAAPLLLWTAAAWPGFFSQDSIDQWGQVVSGRWVDVHPPAHTALLALGWKLGSPGWLAAAQAVALAAGMVAVAAESVRAGASKRLMAAVLGAAALAPSVGAVAATHWKDVPFTVAGLFFAAALLRGSLGRAMAFAVALVVLRQNGFVVAAAGLFALGMARLPDRRAALRPAGFALTMPALWLAARFVLYPAVGVAPAPPSVVIQPLLHDFAAFVRADPKAVLEPTWAVLERAGTRRDWHAGYDCRSLHQLLNRDGFDPAGLGDATAQIRGLWARQLRRQPDVFVRHRLCTAGLAFDPRDDWTLTLSPTVEDNRFGLAHTPLHQRLYDAQFSALEWSRTAWRRAWFWRSPRWMGLALLLLGTAAVRRREARLLVPLAPALGQVAAVALANPAWDARYCALAGLLSVLLLPLAASRLRPDG